MQFGKRDNAERYRREISRLQTFLESLGVYLVQVITRELLTEFMSAWADLYPASPTRIVAGARLRSFLRFCCHSVARDTVLNWGRYAEIFLSLSSLSNSASNFAPPQTRVTRPSESQHRWRSGRFSHRAEPAGIS